jgi:hypothetical protein
VVEKARTIPTHREQAILFDRENEMQPILIPVIQYSEAEPLGSKSFAEIQTRVWWMYIRSMISEQSNNGDKSADLSDDAARKWLDRQLDTDERGLRANRLTPRKFVPEKTLALVEQIIPGSASMYFEGPDLSCLWPVLAGCDGGAAMIRFRMLTGLTSSDINGCTPDFLVTLLDCFEPIALHALAAMLNTFSLRYASREFKLRDLLWFFDQNYHTEIQYLHLATNSDLISEMVEDPWYKRAVACLNHNATIGRLSVYGLARSDILNMMGQPKLYPKKEMGTANLKNQYIAASKIYSGADMNIPPTIRMERGEIPSHPKIKGVSKQLDTEDTDYVTLATFARYWHAKTSSC